MGQASGEVGAVQGESGALLRVRVEQEQDVFADDHTIVENN